MRCWDILALCDCFFFFKQKTAYEMRISDWSSDVCSSDLRVQRRPELVAGAGVVGADLGRFPPRRAAAEDEPQPRREDVGKDGGAEGWCVISRSEERRVGKECGSKWRSRLSSYS